MAHLNRRTETGKLFYEKSAYSGRSLILSYNCCCRGVVKSSSGESLPGANAVAAGSHPYKIPQQMAAAYDSDFQIRRTGQLLYYHYSNYLGSKSELLSFGVRV